MNTSVSRKRFLLGGGIAALGAFVRPEPFRAARRKLPATESVIERRAEFSEHDPQIDRARVKRFVIAGHFNLEAVKEMLGADPTLINGAIDWGNGDFETALGGASHMGRRDIAEFLLEHNARMDIFAATMLGKLDIVKAAVAAFPNIVNVLDPHKIPLITHAEKGGENAKAALEFLSPLAAKK